MKKKVLNTKKYTLIVDLADNKKGFFLYVFIYLIL